MNDGEKQRYHQLKQEIDNIRHDLDVLHKDEVSILAEIEALEREARERGLHDIEQQLLAACTRMVAAGSVLAQVSIDLQVPPTVFEPALKPHEQPAGGEEERKEAS
ncbi:MAG: hypothetical protein ACYDCO_22300 [Armatimonadota bacterium]